MKTTECIEAWCGTRCGCYEQGKAEAMKEGLEIIEYSERTWDNDKDRIFEEGYMENLFNELKQKIQALTPNKGEQK